MYGLLACFSEMIGLFWPLIASIFTLLDPAASLPLLSFCLFGIQADAETDEVYAQMTLQPLNPVHDSEISIGYWFWSF